MEAYRRHRIRPCHSLCGHRTFRTRYTGQNYHKSNPSTTTYTNAFSSSPSPSPAPSPTPPPISNQVHITITFPGNYIINSNIPYSSNLSVLQSLVAASDQINLLYEIKQTGLGQFVYSIDGYKPTGTSGWQYAVNGSAPDVGAADYILSNQDHVQWFFGSPGSTPY